MGRSKVVVILDDDRLAARSLTSLLTRAGYAVVPVFGADEALDYFEGSNPCAVMIIDIMMRSGRRLSPEETLGGVATGLEVVKRIKSQRKSRSPQFIAYTVTKEPFILAALSDLGVNVLNKLTQPPAAVLAAITGTVA